MLINIFYYSLLTLAYVWTVVQLAAGEPFDALVLFLVTWTFQTYRSAIRKGLSDE